MMCLVFLLDELDPELFQLFYYDDEYFLDLFFLP